MSVKLADTLAPLGSFEVAKAEDISVEIDGTTKMLQDAIDNGEIGGGDSSFEIWKGTLAEWEALDKSTLEDNTIISITDDANSSHSKIGFIDTDNLVLDVYSSTSTTEAETKEWTATDDCYVLVVLTTIVGTQTTKAYLNDVVMASNGSTESWSRSGFYAKKGQKVKVVGRFSILAYGLL